MAFSITSKNNNKIFTDKELINISSKSGCDYFLNTDFEFMLTVQYDNKTNKCILFNRFNNQKFLFKGKPIPSRLEVNNVCKIMIDGSDEFITIKVLENSFNKPIVQEDFKEKNIRSIYDNDINSSAKLKVEEQKNEIEHARISIIKEVGAKINELKHKISMNSKGGIFLHITMFLASLICAFGVSNYLTGLPLENVGEVIQMPTNIKLIFVYATIIFSVGLMLKQGVYLYMQNKLERNTLTSKIAERFMICLSLVFYVAIYLINTLYYLSPKSMSLFAIIISVFFVGTAATLAVCCGFIKHFGIEERRELDNYEYREDFEHVIKKYQKWIERFANTLSNSKINAVKDKLVNLQIKSTLETILGIFTAPFLAYGVSNTLASCFPEAAGWIRISGLRFSPVFLVLATFLIIFAFFNFVNGFFCNKKIQASNVIKQDGFSNYLQHGVDIYGLEGAKRLDIEMRRSFIIGICIIFIEFSMNVSFFMQSIGGDLSGILLSAVAALVPTALLIAETFMLSATKFDTFACEELIAKTDRD